MKRIVSILLTLAMLLTITPTHAFAASSGVTETVVSARSGIRQPMEPVVLYEPEQTPPDGISYAEVRLPTTVTGEGDRVEQGGQVSVVFYNGSITEKATSLPPAESSNTSGFTIPASIPMWNPSAPWASACRIGKKR